ncbi:hypothetical protein C0Q70_02860 [Pomacea canaliculata]|uniref:C2H2-type domain-containing protein n=1 Tax=Pomacea canaliculata TaxID=400727 RepID=A0A2T7PR40_POMCA|nr:hypothetical protein C0Q70_02860 [Pomacea canaliculata]
MVVGVAVDNEDHTEEAPALGVDSKTELLVKKRSASNESVGKRDEKPEDKKENSLSFSNTNCDAGSKKEELSKGEKPVVKEEKEKEIRESVPQLTLPLEKVVVKEEKDAIKEEDKEEKKKEGKDDEGLEKYLESSDTVVIYPEPVSDHDENSTAEDAQGNTEEEYTLKCVHCTETFVRASLLRDHMRAVHPDMPVKYLCPKCDDTFLLKSHLDKHLALHSPTSQVCKVCNKMFANVYRLQRHMISHDESSYSSHMNSKKCWVLNMKGRRMDRNGNTADNTASSLMYQSVGIGFSQSASGGGGSMQSSPPGAYPSQFLKYDARGAVVPTLYSPPMTSAGFGAYSMLGVAAGKHLPVPVPAHHHPHSHPLLAASLPAPPIACPKLPDMPPSPAYSRTQISPDVNFNTQLFNPASGEKVLALNKSSSKEQDSNSFDMDKVKVKKENIDEAIKEEVDQKDTADSPERN